jgi:hypothetical protein
MQGTQSFGYQQLHDSPAIEPSDASCREFWTQPAAEHLRGQSQRDNAITTISGFLASQWVVAISGRILDGLIGANQMHRAPLSFSDCGEL